MYTYSKKSLRRIHAIPAAIALLVMALAWYFSDSQTAHAASLAMAVIAPTNCANWLIS